MDVEGRFKVLIGKRPREAGYGHNRPGLDSHLASCRTCQRAMRAAQSDVGTMTPAARSLSQGRIPCGCGLSRVALPDGRGSDRGRSPNVGIPRWPTRTAATA